MIKYHSFTRKILNKREGTKEKPALNPLGLLKRLEKKNGRCCVRLYIDTVIAIHG